MEHPMKWKYRVVHASVAFEISLASVGLGTRRRILSRYGMLSKTIKMIPVFKKSFEVRAGMKEITKVPFNSLKIRPGSLQSHHLFLGHFNDKRTGIQFIIFQKLKALDIW